MGWFMNYVFLIVSFSFYGMYTYGMYTYGMYTYGMYTYAGASSGFHPNQGKNTKF